MRYGARMGASRETNRRRVMAQVIERIWRSGPRKVKRSAWGYTLQINGKQEQKSDARWSVPRPPTHLRLAAHDEKGGP